MNMHPYLTFDGHCEAAFQFYEKVFDAKICDLHRFGDTPDAGQIAAQFHNRIMHVTMEVNGQVLMGSDTMPDQPYGGMQGFSLSLSINDVAHAERLFKDLSDGGTVKMALQPTFWAARFGMLNDRFGTPWMINCEHPALA